MTKDYTDCSDYVSTAELDSDIEHLEEVLQGEFKGCDECRKDHERLLSYMKELKWYRENSSESYPKSNLKPAEKKYRPFTLKEFLDKFPMLSTVTLRKKGDNDCIITCILTGYRHRLICTDICLGVEWISLGTLADEYEYLYMYSKIWKPFGVEE